MKFILFQSVSHVVVGVIIIFAIVPIAETIRVVGVGLIGSVVGQLISLLIAPFTLMTGGVTLK